MKPDLTVLPAAWEPSGQQRVFRCLMKAFAYPGRIVTVAEQEGEAVTLVLATLVDASVNLADPHHLLGPLGLVRLETTGAVAEAADFILLSGQIPPDFEPRLGSLESPHQSATLIVRVDRLGSGPALALSGPGIPGTEHLRVSGLSPEWILRRADWVADFPLGIDLLLVDGLRVAAVPRTSRIAGPTVLAQGVV